MKWITNEQTETSKNDTSDNKFYEHPTSMFDENEQVEERLSPNLSMDEVRSLLDEFEAILHGK